MSQFKLFGWGVKLKLRTRIIAPIIVAMLLASAVVLFGLQRMSATIIADTLQHETQSGQLLVNETTNEVTKNLEGLIFSLMSNPDFIHAMQAHDRERLYQLGQPYLAQWQALSGVTHFYFHNPDGVNLLRVHLKDKFGDQIKRKSLQRALESGKTGIATEVGLTGEWVRRVVVPWKVDGRLMGYVELGVDMEYIYASVHKNMNSSTLILLNKNLIQSPDIWEARRKKLNFSPYAWDTLPDQVVVVNVGSVIEPAQLAQLILNKKTDNTLNIKGNVFTSQTRSLYGESGVGSATALPIIGTEVQLLDVSNVQTLIERGIQMIVWMFVLLLCLLLLAMYEFLGRIQRRLDAEEAVLLKAKEVAEAGSRAKNEFLSSMSHELRTPLNAVIGFAQLLRMDHDISDKTRGHVLEIEHAGEHLLSLVNDVIDLARIEAGKMELSLEGVSVRSVINKSLALIAPLAEKQGITIINLSTVDDTQAVRTDASRLRQILINFLSNAIKYNRPQGSVTLKTQTVGERMRISVSDTGMGIPLAKQNRLFNEAFDRLGKENGAIEGTGIGLVITKRVCEAMDGKIGFASVEGEGSTFWIELPHTAPLAIMAEAALVRQQPVLSADKAAQLILLAEDNRVNQRLAMALLNRQGYQVELVENGKEAVTAAATGKYALVLMDCQMPEMSGFEATKAIRRAEVDSGKHLPIIALTANAMEGDRKKCLASGMDDYLSKPINAAQLQEMLQRWLNNSNLSQ